MNKRSKYYKYNIEVTKEHRDNNLVVYVSYYMPHYSVNMSEYILHSSTTIVKSFKDFIRLIRAVFRDIDSRVKVNVK